MSQPSAYKVLASRYWDVVLVNVRVHNNRITCGFAYFDAGLPESVVVKSGNSSYSIRIPDTIQKARTYTLLTSPADAIEFQVVAN